MILSEKGGGAAMVSLIAGLMTGDMMGIYLMSRDRRRRGG